MESGRWGKKKKKHRKWCLPSQSEKLSGVDWVPIQHTADSWTERAAADVFEQCASCTSGKAGPLFWHVQHVFTCNVPPLRQGGATGPRGQEAGVRIFADIRHILESKCNEREVKRWRRGFLRERFLRAERTGEFPEGGEAGWDVNLLGKWGPTFDPKLCANCSNVQRAELLKQYTGLWERSSLRMCRENRLEEPS